MIFVQATERYREDVLLMYRQSVGTDGCTWNEQYPGEQEIDEDLAAGCLYVALQDGAAVAALSVVPENELDELPCWKVKDGICREIARVVVSRDLRGKGLAAWMMLQAEELLRKDGCKAIHLLAAVGNRAAVATYRKCGFDFLDTHEMYANLYYACEKVL